MRRNTLSARRFTGCALSAVLLLCACDGGLDGSPAPSPDGLRIEKAFPNLTFDQPLALTQAPGDASRIFVATKPGVVYVFSKSASVATKQVFLDLSSKLTAEGEQGLLGLAFDPDYGTNGYFYVYYSPSFGNNVNQRRTLVARYQVSANPDVANAGSETPLLSIPQPNFTNHKGGWIGFGPDDKLYIATGDGGGVGDPQNNAQNLNVLLGKILRLNRDGSIPGNNPLVGQTGKRAEIWAYGLRNPFRASFDRDTGTLWAGDVGQGAWEEIDIIERAGNYGWRKFEGNHVNNTGDLDPGNTIAPEWEYDHSNGRCSVTGGYVYRGAALEDFDGAYLYADFCSSELWALSPSGDSYSNTALGRIPGQVTSFGEDAAGEIYVTSFDGNIYKLVPVTN